MKYARTVLVTIGVVAVLVGMTQVASATMIQIQMGGVDLFYTGGVVKDAGTSAPDPLTNATFFVDGAEIGRVTEGVTLDLRIPGVENLPTAFGSVTSSQTGTLELMFGDDYLNLTLQSATVTNIPLTETLNIIFIASASELSSQQLPFGITIGEPISVSFSTHTTVPVSKSGNHITVFRSAGTGEITGVPEPATMTLLAIGGVTMLMRRRRHRA